MYGTQVRGWQQIFGVLSLLMQLVMEKVLADTSKQHSIKKVHTLRRIMVFKAVLRRAVSKLHAGERCTADEQKMMWTKLSLHAVAPVARVYRFGGGLRATLCGSARH